LFAVRRQGVISVSVVLRRGVIVVIRGVIVVIWCGHHCTWVGRHRPGGGSFGVAFAGGARSSFVGTRSSFVNPVVVDVGCHSVVVGPRSPLTAWRPCGHLSVVWVVAVRGWVMVVVDGGWCLQAIIVHGWAVFVICGQSSSHCGQSSFVGGWSFLGGRDRRSWVGDGGHRWWCCRSSSWGPAVMGVRHPESSCRCGTP